MTHSVLAAEVIALSDAFNDGFSLYNELKAAFKRNVPLILLTDSKLLFDIIQKRSQTSKMRMMLDIAAAGQGYKSNEISNIGFVRSSKKLSDGAPKTMHHSSMLDVMRTG